MFLLSIAKPVASVGLGDDFEFSEGLMILFPVRLI